MRKVIIRPEAEVDIEDAADYMIAQWGREQARQYVGDLRNAIERLATHGMHHPEEVEVFPSLRRMRSGHHLIFYLIDDEQVDVVRVLHERRDIVRHLIG